MPRTTALAITLSFCFLSSLKGAATEPTTAPSNLKAPIDATTIGFKVAPNWKAELIAKPPELKWPSVVEQAPDGKIFVGEHAMDMPGPANEPIDRILCIHPDGHITVFADHLMAVFALRYIDGKLIVHQSPILTVYTDDNGVGKDPHNLIDSTYRYPDGHNLNDHIPANIRLGMDNYLYMAVGDKGIFNARGNGDGSKAENHGGCIFRFRPDGSELEIYANGTRNHLDMGINSEDEIFTYDNTDDGQGWWCRYTHMVDGGFYGYPFDYKVPTKPETYGHNGEKRDPTKPFWPWTLWRIEEYGGGSPCGAVGYNEDALPVEYKDNTFHCEWGKGNFERFAVERDGGTYKVVKHETLLSGPNFRPLGVSVTSDGSGFLIADWEMGGWNNAKEQGRLFKLTYTGPLNPTARPAWYVPAAMGQKTEASIAELIAGLSHPAESVRLVAQRRIAEHGTEAVAPLVALLNDASKPPFARWHAIWTLDLIDGGKTAHQAIIAIATGEKQEMSVRRQAIRQLGTRRAKEAAAPLTPLLKNSDASLRFRVATALGRIGDPSATPALLAQLDESDFFTHYADFLALRRIGSANPTAWRDIAKGLLSDDPKVREGVLLAAHETYDPALVDALAAILADKSAPAAGRAAALEALAPLHHQRPAWDGKWWATQPAGSPPAEKTVVWAGTQIVLDALRNGLKDSTPEIRRAAIASLEVAPDPEAVQALADMFSHESDLTTRRAILHALAASKSPAAIDVVGGVFKDPSQPAPMVEDALAVAESVNTPKAVDAIVAYIDSNPPDVMPAFAALERMKATRAVPAVVKQISNPKEPVALAAINLLGHIGDAGTGKLLLPSLTDPRETVQKAVITSLGRLQYRPAVPALIEQYASNPKTHNETIDALARMPDAKALDAYLDGLGGQDAGIRDECRKAITAISQPSLPLIEARLDSAKPIPVSVVQELQRIYSSFQPIMRWKIIGPFEKDGPEPLSADELPITEELKGLKGTVKWKAANGSSPHGQIDLFKEFSPNEHCSAYCVAEILSQSNRDAEFEGGSDDGVILWVNGEKIYQDLGNHGYNFDAFHAKGHLKAGKNVILCKITQDGGPWEFSVAVSGQRQGKLFTFDTSGHSPSAYASFALAHPGNAESGSAIFHNAQGVGCIKCHTVDGQGGNVGPNLSDVAIKYPREHLIEDVLYPSKQIESGYQQTIIKTKDGDVQSGVVRQETDEEVTMYDSTARKIVIRKSDIAQRKLSNLSVMPEGLQAGLSHEQFADLIAYLESLKHKQQ